MLKVYTDQQYIIEKTGDVFPLLFDLCYTKNEHLLEQYELMDQMVEADVVIVPIDISEYFQKKQQSWLNDYIDKALGLHKKVWVYSDFGLSINKAVFIPLD
jgi:hypothetical protein